VYNWPLSHGNWFSTCASLIYFILLCLSPHIIKYFEVKLILYVHSSSYEIMYVQLVFIPYFFVILMSIVVEVSWHCFVNFQLTKFSLYPYYRSNTCNSSIVRNIHWLHWLVFSILLIPNTLYSQRNHKAVIHRRDKVYLWMWWSPSSTEYKWTASSGEEQRLHWPLRSLQGPYCKAPGETRGAMGGVHGSEGSNLAHILVKKSCHFKTNRITPQQLRRRLS